MLLTRAEDFTFASLIDLFQSLSSSSSSRLQLVTRRLHVGRGYFPPLVEARCRFVSTDCARYCYE